MQIAKHKVVTIDYTLTDSEGNVFDSSAGSEPLAYIHGAGNIIPGLERALEGRQTGEELRAIVPPAEGYGERDDDLVQIVPRDAFEGIDELEIGMQFQTMTEAGPRIVTVVEIEGEEVTVDGNHPLAGMVLNFDVTIRGVRDASEEELQHGHVHGAGGHEH